MEYPRELVHRYGAKAGVLMYVARELPAIPQAAMVVNYIGEPVDNFLERADAVPILWPRLFRSSAVSELQGDEGRFHTELVDGFDEGHERVAWNDKNFSIYRNEEYFERGIREVVRKVASSAQNYDEDGRDSQNPGPDEINVIIAEKSPSRYVGTLIKHPNQDNLQLMTISDTEFARRDDPLRFLFRSTFSYRNEVGVRSLGNFSQRQIQLTPSLVKDLKEIATWHDRIAALTEMDAKWAYQIEFGAEPVCLYQVRPFKPVEYADFRLGKSNVSKHGTIVIGITSREGVNVRAEVYEDRHLPGKESLHANLDNQPSLFYGEMKESFETRGLRNHQANILYWAYGFLAHKDIAAMRKAQVTILTPVQPTRLSVRQGDWVNIVSDGTNVKVKNLSVAQAAKNSHQEWIPIGS